MIKISVNGNRSDIAGYLSYYSCEEIGNLLDINQEEITYKTTVTDYFSHGDIDFEGEVEVKVTISDNYYEFIEELTNIIVKYVGYFTNKCSVYYELVDSRLIYIYENKNKDAHKHECECGHCHCHEEEHECECGDECHCGDDCHCHEEGHTCKCGEECNCGEDCNCGEECHCHEGRSCHCEEE